MNDEFIGALLLGWIVYLIVFKLVGIFPVSKVIVVGIIVGSIIAPTQSKMVLTKSVDFIHTGFTMVTQHINMNSK
jgi:hypothetical protein